MKKATGLRYEHIDTLRAFGIIGVIATHVYSYHLDSRIHFLIWNYLHFVVVAFVFCSGYVMAERYYVSIRNPKELFTWYRKRIIRLLLPFYSYLILHIGLMLLFPHSFTGLGIKLTAPFMVRTLTLFGGLDLNWLPLLFVELTLLYPFLRIYMATPHLRRLTVIVTIGAALIFTVIPFPYAYYRWVMWIPWSFFILLADTYYQQEKSGIRVHRYIKTSLIAATIFIILSLSWPYFNRSYTLTDNKYPPDLLYLSYATMMTFLALAVTQAPFFRTQWIRQSLSYISAQSYQLFFIHYILMDLILHLPRGTVSSEPFIQFLIVLPLSLAGCYLLTTISSLLKTRRVRV